MVNINNKIYVVKKGDKLKNKALEWMESGNPIAYVERTDKKFFEGKGKYIYDFRHSWDLINRHKLDELEHYINKEIFAMNTSIIPLFYKPNSTNNLSINETRIEFDHLWEERKKIHKKMLEKLLEKDMVIDFFDQI